MASLAPLLKLNNGLSIPSLGLGTSQFSYKPGDAVPTPSTEGTQEAVESAIDIGYRHFDTALMYRNEVEVGKGIKNRIDAGVVGREDLFVTTKLWSTYNNPARVIDGLKRSLKNLQLDYVDLFLIHSPASYHFFDENNWLGFDASGKTVYEKVDHAEMWKKMEDAVHLGLTRSIGLSNFGIKQIQYILDSCKIKPANLQVEGHAYLMQPKLFDFCQKHGITFTAYAPLGSPARWTKKASDPVLMEETVVKQIAEAHGKTPSQVLIRYLVQNGRIAIPRSTSKDHLKRNFEVFDFQLSDDELNQLKNLDSHTRYFPFDHIRDSADFPFSDDQDIKASGS